MNNKHNIKVQLLENLNYYPIEMKDLIYKNFSYYIVDAVKKSIIFDLERNLFISVIGSVFIQDNFIKFSNPFIFYCFSSYYKNNLSKLLNQFFKDYIIIDNIELLNNVNDFHKILSKIELNKNNIFIIFFDIPQDFIWPINEYLENYTTYLMLNLEAFFIYFLLYHNLKSDYFIISDGNILKLKNIIKFIENENLNKIIGIIKNQRENYYKHLDFKENQINFDKYLYNLPYQNRTAIIQIDYYDFKVNTFYFNPFNTINFNNLFLNNHILRIENLVSKDSIYYLKIISNFILDLTKGVLPLYFRMPENNIILTKLENYLKKFIPNETILKYMLIH
ncbi:MAG: hypothetical protein ACP5RD_04745 [bacterium]